MMTQPDNSTGDGLFFDCATGKLEARPLTADERDAIAAARSESPQIVATPSLADKIAAGVLAALTAAGATIDVSPQTVADAVATALGDPQPAPAPQADAADLA